MDQGLLAHLGGLHALVLGEVGEFAEGEGMRVSLLPQYVLVQVQTEGMESHMLIDLTSLLDAITTMNRTVGN